MQIFNKYEQDYKQACRLFIRERDRFYVDLQQIGYLRVIPSQANYFLCEVISKYSSKELTELLLNEYNILIKDCGTKKAFRNGEYIRIAVTFNFRQPTFNRCIKRIIIVKKDGNENNRL